MKLNICRKWDERRSSCFLKVSQPASPSRRTLDLDGNFMLVKAKIRFHQYWKDWGPWTSSFMTANIHMQTCFLSSAWRGSISTPMGSCYRMMSPGTEPSHNLPGKSRRMHKESELLLWVQSSSPIRPFVERATW